MNLVQEILQLLDEPISNCFPTDQTQRDARVESNTEGLLREALQSFTGGQVVEDKTTDKLRESLRNKFLRLPLPQANFLIILLLLALQKRLFNVVELLVNAFKAVPEWEAGIQRNSYNILCDSMTSSQKKTELGREDDAINCLEFSFKHEIIKDINQTNRRLPQFKLRALSTAADCNYQRVMAFLMKKGASLNGGGEKEDIIDTLTTETLTEVMDYCIQPEANQETSNHGDGRKEIVLKMDYSFLIPPSGEGFQKETKTLMDICLKKKHRDVISHPLVKTLIQAKWSKVRNSYHLFLFIQSLCFILLLFLVTLRTWPMSNIQKPHTGWGIVIGFLCFIELIMDIIWWGLCFKLPWPLRSRKHRLIEMACHPVLMIVIAVLCFVPLQDDLRRHSTAWVVPITWLTSIVNVGQNLPPFKIFITMLRRISWHLMKLTILTFALIFAFSISFSVLAQTNEDSESGSSVADFGSPWNAFPRVVAMATGEFGYDALREGLLVEERTAAFVSAVLLFLVFVFLVFLVIMNVMTGVAIIEAQTIKEADTRDTLQHRLEVTFLLEKISLDDRWPKFIKRPQLQRLCRKTRTLKVRIDEPKEKMSNCYRASTSSSQGSRCFPCGVCECSMENGKMVDDGGPFHLLNDGDSKQLRSELLQLLERKQKKERKEQRRKEKERLEKELRRFMNRSVETDLE